MKKFIFALALGISTNVFAQTTQVDLIKALDNYYAADNKYQACVTQLLDGKPVSVPASYQVRLIAASFAENLISACKMRTANEAALTWGDEKWASEPKSWGSTPWAFPSSKQWGD